LTAPISAGTANLTAKAAAGDAGKTAAVAFTADTSTARVVTLTPSKTTGLANGTDSVTLTATVQDAHGNPVGAGVTVNWGTSLGKLASATSATNASSTATVVLTAPISAGTANLTAKAAAGDAGKTAAVAFTADPSTARVVTLTPSKTTGLANGTDTVTLTATVEDANGNPVGAGVTVNWGTSLGSLASATSTTNASSAATVVLRSPTAPGTANLMAKAVASDPGKTAAVVFNVDTSTARVVTLTPSKTTGLANGTDTVTLTATVQDAHGNPVGAGVTVNWGTGLGKLASATSATNASSIATVVLTAPTSAGTANLTAKAVASDPGKTAAVTFTADASTARVVTLAPSKTTGLANGTDSVTLTATVQDANGNPVGAGVTVNWGTSLGKLASATSATNASSTATVVLTAPTSAGTANLTAKAAAGDAGKTASVAFTADPSTARVVTLTPSKTTGLANGTDTVTLTATVEDANGNPVGAGVTVNWGTSLGKLASATSATNASGTATVVLGSPTAPGTANLTAKAVASDPGKTAAVVFNVDTSTARVVTLTPSKTTGLANGADTVTLTATVEDAHGNPVGAGVTVDWGASFGDLASSTSTTNASSTATIVLTAPTAPGIANVTAKASASDAGKITSVTFNVDTSTARVVKLSVDKATALANGVDVVTLTAAVEDVFGNPVGAGVKVNWGASLGDLASSTADTDSRGIAKVVLTAPTTTGTANLTAKAVAADPGKTAGVVFLADASTARVVTLTPSKTTGLANGTDSVTLTATVEDANGNPVGSGVTVNWGTSLGSLASATSTTDPSSTATVVLRSPTAPGTANLTAKAVAGDAGKTASVVFNVDKSTARVVTLTPSKTTGLANGTDTVTLTATVQDAHGNPVGAGVTVNWGTGLGSLASATSTTNASSTATVVLRSPTTPGTANLTAKAVAGDAGKTASVVFNVDTSTARVVTLTPSKTTGLANGTDSVTLTATVQDAHGNPVGAGVTVNWGTSRGTLANATSMTNASSTATVVLKAPTAAGVANLTAKAVAADPGKTGAVTFTADASTARVVTLTPSKTTGLANGTDSVTLTATVQDANGNPVGAGVTVNWGTSRGTLASTTSATNASSTATVVLKAPTAAGVANLTAKAVAADPGKTGAVTFTADASTARVVTLTPSKTTGLANGTDTVTLTATVQDANGNPVGAGVTVNWGTSRGTLASATSATNASSTATVVLKAPTAAGVANLTAKAVAADPGKTGAVTFTADASTARVVTLTPSKTTALVNSTDSVTLTATVQDANGNLVGAGVTVNWGTSLGNLASATSATNASGTATVVLRSPSAAGTANLTAKAVASDPGKTAAVVFNVDPALHRVFVVNASKTTGYVDGADRITFSAVVRDSLGRNVAGVDVTWSASPNAIIAAGTKTKTDANGLAAVDAIGTAGGVHTITATAAAADPGKSVNVTFTTPSIVGLAMSAGQINANGVATSTATATVAFPDGKPYVGAIQFHAAIGTFQNGSNVLTTTTGGTGQAQVVIKSSTPGNGQITASIGQIAPTRPVLIVFAGASLTSLDPLNNNVPANGSSTITLRAGVHFPDGTPAVGFPVTWANTGGVLSAATTYVGADGFTYNYISSTTAVTHGIYAYYNGGQRYVLATFATMCFVESGAPFGGSIQEHQEPGIGPNGTYTFSWGSLYDVRYYGTTYPELVTGGWIYYKAGGPSQYGNADWNEPNIYPIQRRPVGC
ncbi:beta strand repeat-containing protein, partial [Achromobacter spanius]|uniref:beta strand repeat-containing protein n=1 Tax=Achromobacter spanius TaxID=217203 RepID=UPI0038089795